MVRSFLMAGLLVAVALSGCIEDDTEAASVDALQDEQAAEHLLTNISLARIHIESNQPEALRATFAVGASNQCAYHGYAEYSEDDNSMVAGAVNSFVFSSRSMGASAAGQRAATNGGFSFAISGNIVPDDGLMDLVLFGRGAWSMQFALNCTGAFDVVTSQSANLVALFSGLNMDGAAAAGLVGGATAAGRLDVNTLEHAQAWLATSGDGEGTWSVSHPNGTWSREWSNWMLGSGRAELHTVAGPAGLWQFELMDAHATIRQPWAAVTEEFQDVNVLTSWSE